MRWWSPQQRSPLTRLLLPFAASTACAASVAVRMTFLIVTTMLPASRALRPLRITSDCPLIDSEIIDKTVRAFMAEQPDYASNTLVRTYPRGLDTEVMTFAALRQAWQEARQPYQRSHVTPYMYESPGRFRILSVTGDEDHSAYRWTVDTPEDLEFVRAIYSRREGKGFRLSDVLRLIEREPQLAEINRAVSQKALHEG